MKLIIFDLDQTLVDLIKIHDEAVRRFFRSMFDREARLTEIDFAGRSLTENLIELGRRKGVSEELARKKGGELLERYEQIFFEIMPQDASSYILPGVYELLERLSRTNNLLVLYTGNSPGITKLVLETTGLEKYFSLSLSGTRVKKRADMVRQAIIEAERITGKKLEGKDIVIIGDSVRDVECGKEFNALTIAVATGFHTEEALRKKAPDYLFKDLTDYNRIMQSIGLVNP